MNFLRLIRYKNLIMVLLTMVLTKYALIHSISQSSFLSTSIFAIVCLSILCLTAAGYIVNDILDVKADLVNKPEKVFIGTSISIKKAWVLYSFLSVIGILCCVYVLHSQQLSYHYLTAYVGTSLLLLLYSSHLKKLPVIGNLLIAGFCATIIYILYLLDDTNEQVHGFWNNFNKIFGDIVLHVMIVYYIVFSFITTLIREMIKDIEDVDGDYTMKMKTLPILIGRKRARNAVIGLSLVFILLLLLVIKSFLEASDGIILGLYFLVFILFPFVYFTYLLWSARTKKQFHFLSNLMKLILFFGILSMILFTFVRC